MGIIEITFIHREEPRRVFAFLQGGIAFVQNHHLGVEVIDHGHREGFSGQRHDGRSEFGFAMMGEQDVLEANPNLITVESLLFLFFRDAFFQGLLSIISKALANFSYDGGSDR